MRRVPLPTAILVCAAALAACAGPRGDESLPVPEGRAPLGGAPAAPDLSAPVRRADLLAQLLARSPRIAAARARLEAAAERRPQAVSLPDPEVEATFFVRNAMAPRDAPRRWELMVRQEIPLPWMLSLRGDAADAAMRAASYRYEAVVRDAVADVVTIHAERRYLTAAIGVQDRLGDVYGRAAVLARSAMKDGTARLPESFRAEALAAQAAYDAGVLREMLAVEDAKLRAILSLPPGARIGAPADADPVLPLDVPQETLTARALEWNQELREMGADAEMARIDADMARWNAVPMPMVGAGRMFRDEFDMATGDTRDSTTVSVGMTLPVWRPRIDAAIREADARVRAADADTAAMRQMLAADVAMAAFRVRTTERLAHLYAQTLVPQAQLAFAAADARVRDGAESVASSLELAATWQQMQLAALRAEADHAQAVAALERLLGTTLRDAEAAE